MRFTIRSLLIGTLIAGVIVYLFSILLHPPWNTVVVRNSSESTITDVELTLTSIDKSWTQTWTIKRLNPNDYSMFEHDYNDTSAVLKYKTDNHPYEYVEEYIDLWRCEQWIFDFLDNGKLESNYSYPKLTKTAG